ncbi:hypothetical protein DRP53_02955 [candidate division WOR-3 bacterium]|uniref:Uncharacterized protein n=1 Tax=candidate division WOR-3 bacterium TaxID=2052148 RepID=A0A660SJW1_UNCW3|nr:MAG: hypothetical protein DRP53_02955 [candidate division WOR-3 bacterium]
MDVHTQNAVKMIVFPLRGVKTIPLPPNQTNQMDQRNQINQRDWPTFHHDPARTGYYQEP